MCRRETKSLVEFRGVIDARPIPGEVVCRVELHALPIDTMRYQPPLIRQPCSLLNSLYMNVKHTRSGSKRTPVKVVGEDARHGSADKTRGRGCASEM